MAAIAACRPQQLTPTREPHGTHRRDAGRPHRTRRGAPGIDRLNRGRRGACPIRESDDERATKDKVARSRAGMAAKASRCPRAGMAKMARHPRAFRPGSRVRGIPGLCRIPPASRRTPRRNCPIKKTTRAGPQGVAADTKAVRPSKAKPRSCTRNHRGIHRHTAR